MSNDVGAKRLLANASASLASRADVRIVNGRAQVREPTFDEANEAALAGLLCGELGAATRLSFACRSNGQSFRRALNVLEGMRAAPSQGAAYVVQWCV